MKGKYGLAVLLACSAGMLASVCTTAVAEEYKVREAVEYAKDRDGQEIPHVATSEHFALKWGNENNKNFKIDDVFVKNALDSFEHIRAVYKDTVGLPLVKSEKDKFKTNIYMSTTGLKPFLEGYAFGFADPEGYGVFDGEPSIMTPGHGAAAHEMGHATQGESGGFRDSDYVGWFWECHAQFMMKQVYPETNLPESLDLYMDMSPFDWSTAVNWHQYSGWIFLQYLKEQPGYGYKVINSLWTTPRANQDEDAVNKLVRVKGLTWKQWGDLFGDYAKRLVTFNSFQYGKLYKAALDKVPERRIYRSRVALEPIKGTKDFYRVPYATAPHQNGFNIVPLRPTAQKITVSFAGLVDTSRKSDWRATVVIVDDKGAERFSQTVNKGTIVVKLKPNEKEVYLVVAAVPQVFEHIKFLEDYRTQERFPYEVRIVGADPTAKPVDVPAGVEGAPHPNGGGFVASTAKVAATAFVGPNAKVLGNAVVKDTARIEDYAVVRDNAKIMQKAIVSGHAQVNDNATVSVNARVRDYVRLYDSAYVDGNARVYDYARVQGNAHLHGISVTRGHANINGANILGNAVFTGASNPGSDIKSCTKGIYTIYVNPTDCENAADMGGVFAKYTFDKPNNLLVKDEIARADGFIHERSLPIGRQSPWVPDRGTGKALCRAYVELPKSISDLRNADISIWVEWNGGAADQHIFDFGRDSENSMYLTPKAKSGNAAFVICGKSVEAKSALPVGKWCNVVVSFTSGKVSMSIDGSVVGTMDNTVYPEDLRADSNYLGRGQSAGYFSGAIDDFVITLKD